MSASSTRDCARSRARGSLFLARCAGFGRLARGDAGDFERLVALDFQLAGALLGGDPLGGEHALARDPSGFHGLLCGDLGFLNRADLPISSDRVRSSEAIRSALTAVVCAMRAFSVVSRGRDLGLVDRRACVRSRAGASPPRWRCGRR